MRPDDYNLLAAVNNSYCNRLRTKTHTSQHRSGLLLAAISAADGDNSIIIRVLTQYIAQKSPRLHGVSADNQAQTISEK